MRTLRTLLALAAALAAAVAARALLARIRQDDTGEQAVTDLWPPVPRKPERVP